MTAPAPMTERRFAWSLDARGLALATWPERERDAALVLLRHSTEARQALAERLAEEDAPAADLAAECRIQYTVRHALAPPSPALHALRWSALAACVAAGLYVGLLPAETDAAAALSPTFQATTSATVMAAMDP